MARQLFLSAIMLLALTSAANAHFCQTGDGLMDAIADAREATENAVLWAQYLAGQIQCEQVALSLAQAAVSDEMATHGCNDPNQCGRLADLALSVTICQGTLANLNSQLTIALANVEAKEAEEDAAYDAWNDHYPGCSTCSEHAGTA